MVDLIKQRKDKDGEKVCVEREDIDIEIGDGILAAFLFNIERAIADASTYVCEGTSGKSNVKIGIGQIVPLLRLFAE
ncbi:hypothetical protein Trydic_g19732 [Trypoxylus dichotomus]